MHFLTGTGQVNWWPRLFTPTRRAPTACSCSVNSGSLPPELLESTLFGHVKGAELAQVVKGGKFREDSTTGST